MASKQSKRSSSGRVTGVTGVTGGSGAVRDPSQPEASPTVEHSGADIDASLLAGSTCVELSAADYVLGALDFAAPVLTTPVTPLYAQDYLLEPLEFGPAWRPGRITVGLRPTGHPPDILDNVKANMIAALVPQLSVLQAARPWTPLLRKDSAVLDFARKLAEDSGIETSDDTLRTQIIRPAFRRWRSGQ
jgi:hypothetical protein